MASVAKPIAVERPTHFTMVEQEDALRRERQRRSWLVIVAQLACLLAALAAMSALAMYVSRPLSADQLHERITAQAKGAEPDSLAVRRNVDEFLQRFPTDPRAGELQDLQQRIELDRNERRLRRGNVMDPSLLPVERQYVRAAALAESSTEQAVVMLQSLVDLYGVSSAKDGEKSAEATDAQIRTSACVRMAERRLVMLRKELAHTVEQQLSSLQERLSMANIIVASDAKRAAVMYAAIIELHQGDAWADTLVAEARERLAKLTEQEVAHE